MKCRFGHSSAGFGHSTSSLVPPGVFKCWLAGFWCLFSKEDEQPKNKIIMIPRNALRILVELLRGNGCIEAAKKTKNVITTAFWRLIGPPILEEYLAGTLSLENQ